MESASKYNYGYFRTDKEKEPGFSHELISSDAKLFCETRGTNLDSLDGT
jgi:hypothetical protein